MRDQTRLRMLCARFGVTAQGFCPHAESNWARVAAPGTPRDGMCAYCHGWHGWNPRDAVEDVMEVLGTPAYWMSEVRAREAACLPGTEAGWL